MKVYRMFESGWIRALMLLIMGGLLLTASICRADFTVMWDQNDPVPDGYRIYSRLEGGTYDYQNSLLDTGDFPLVNGVPGIQWTIGDLLPPLPDINPAESLSVSYDRSTSQVSINWTQPPPLVNDQLYYLVVRAYLGEFGQPDFLESADSEEVSVIQSNGNIAEKWEIFYSLTAGGPYTLLDSVTSEGGVTVPLTVVSEGERKEVFFVVVTFGEAGTFSPNSAEVSTIVDRRTLPTPPSNVEVDVIVPVQ